MRVKQLAMTMAGTAVAVTCLSGCIPDREEHAPTEAETASQSAEATDSPSAAALEDIQAAIIDPSRSTWQRNCAQRWLDANSNDLQAPDCYLTSVDTDSLGLVPASPSREVAPTPGTPTERAAAYRALKDVAADPSETRGDRDCASDWLDAVYNGDDYAPTCGDVPGVSGDVFGLEENPYAS